MNRDDRQDDVERQLAELRRQYDVAFSDEELNELRDHISAFQERVDIVRNFELAHDEEPALYLSPAPKGGQHD